MINIIAILFITQHNLTVVKLQGVRKRREVELFMSLMNMESGDVHSLSCECLVQSSLSAH